jgi:transposase
VIHPDLEAQILRLYNQEHWPVGTIAGELRVHHSVVGRVLTNAELPRKCRVNVSKLDPYAGFIDETLRRYPRILASRLHAMCRERGYLGGASHFRRFISLRRPRKPAEAFLRLRTLPGEQAQVDWGHFGRIAIGRAQRQLLAFVIVLSYSRAIFLRFFLGASTENFLRGHRAAFEHWGGVPRVVLYDNLKSAVLERVGEAIRFHPMLRDFATHYGYEPRPVAVARGNEKGRVERAIRYIRSSFFEARRWRDVEDLNEQALAWCLGLARERAWPEDSSRTVAEAFAEEEPRLLALPGDAFPTEEMRSVSIGKTPYARFEGNDYSVPHDRVRRTLVVRATPEQVRILEGSEVLVEHPRSYDKGQQIEDPAHIRALVEEKRAAKAHRGIDRLAHAAPQSKKLLEALAERGERLGAATRQLERLLDHYGAPAMQRALAAALNAKTLHLHAVRHLLEQERRLAGELPRIPVELPDDPRVRELRVKPHDLGAYDALNPPRSPSLPVGPVSEEVRDEQARS